MRILIVGAGLTGSVLARELASAGHFIELIDERHYIGGNCYTKVDPDTGITLHVHGPHIFHTDDSTVWNYINAFGRFEPFVHRAKATTHGSVYSLPINLLTINQFFGKTLRPDEARAFLAEKADAIATPITLEDQALGFVGPELYKAFYEGYSAKQWGLHPKLLPASVLKRLPVRFDYDDNYFSHRYQGIPRDGYTALVDGILNHANISVRLSTAFHHDMRRGFDHVFYSGKLDRWFDYRFDELGYRTLSFEREVFDGDYQGCAVMNFPDMNIPFTRITEHKHFTPWQRHDRTIIFKEYSSLAARDDIPYYPIRLANEKASLTKYVEAATRETNVSFVGRLGTYRYLDMDVSIAEALQAARQFIDITARAGTVPVFFNSPL